jgi:hypothetical protein
MSEDEFESLPLEDAAPEVSDLEAAFDHALDEPIDEIEFRAPEEEPDQRPSISRASADELAACEIADSVPASLEAVLNDLATVSDALVAAQADSVDHCEPAEGQSLFDAALSVDPDLDDASLQRAVPVVAALTTGAGFNVGTGHVPVRFSRPAGDTPLEIPREIIDEGVEPDADDFESDYTEDRAGAWTLPMLFAGLALIACAIIIPATEENRQLVWEREKLKRDLVQINTQIEVNDEFLKRVVDDSTLLERLAQRQMKLIREGTSVLEISSTDDVNHVSPFQLLTLPPPPALAPYEPKGGRLSAWARQSRTRLLMTGAGLMLVACGLVLGNPTRRQPDKSAMVPA